MSFDMLIKGGIIISMEPDSRPFVGSMAIERGRIAAIWEGSDQREPAREIIDATDMIVMPGLINGHVHGDMTVARGLGDDKTLREQMTLFDEIGWFSEMLSAEDRFVSRQLTYIEAVKSGTTFLCENMFWSLGLESIRAMREVGLQGALVEDARPDFLDPKVMDIAEMKAFCSAARAEGFIPIVGGVAEEDYDHDLMQQIKSMARQCEAMVHTHLAETDWRCERIKQEFKTTPVRYRHANDLMGDWLLASHAVWVDDDEVELLADRGTRIVNTPTSEMKINDGIAPIPKYLAADIPVGLGTDGAMWNNCNDIFREMKTLVLLHQIGSGIRSLNARQVLEMATIRGAMVFKQELETGSLATGKRADVILIDANQPHLRPLVWRSNSNVISNLVYCATGRDVQTVIIDGRLVVIDRVLQTLDEYEVLIKAQEIGEKLAKETL